MQLSELKLDTLFLANTVLTQYKAIDIERNLNTYYDEIVSDIWREDNTWKFDDSSDTLPIAVSSISSGQSDYQLPTDARQVEGIELDLGDNNIKTLNPVSIYDIKHRSDDSESTPTKYFLKGRSIMLFPVPDEDIDDGLIVYVSRSVTQLEESTDEPKIEREFHRFLSIGAAKDWYFVKGNFNKVRELERKLERMRMRIIKFYQNRNQDYTPRINPTRMNYD